MEVLSKCTGFWPVWATRLVGQEEGLPTIYLITVYDHSPLTDSHKEGDPSPCPGAGQTQGI